jgi:hypothetical protein
MADEAKNSVNLFYDFYGKYFSAKQRNLKHEVRFYALMSLVQVHQFAGSPGPTKGAEAMHKLRGAVLTESQTSEMYKEPREDSGVAEKG